MSWTRAELKEKARNFLKEHYWKAFFATLIVKLISGEISIESDIMNISNYSTYFLLWLLFILFSTFVIDVIRVGLAKFYIEGEKGNVDISNIFSIFTSGSYLNVVKIMFLMKLYIVLWTFLLIIPGMIKSYEYMFIPYILAENPNMDVSEVFQETKRMTNKQKGAMFLLDLSFIGWYLLGALMIIGEIFVVPYHKATKTQLYFELKK